MIRCNPVYGYRHGVIIVLVGVGVVRCGPITDAARCLLLSQV
jgi:hypothetical protein